MSKEIAVQNNVQRLASMGEKDYLRFICEALTNEFNYLTRLYNQEKDKELIGISFYNSLHEQPKRKAMYASFLERQDDPNPKSWKNAMRFIRHLQLTSEFQTR